MLIDTHSHLTMPEFSDLSEVLNRAKESGVEAIINASFDLESSKKSVELSQKKDFIYAAVGIHPNDSEMLDDRSFAEIKKLAGSNKVVAIGETGLDYHYGKEKKDLQKAAFREFLKLSQELSLPAIIHCRESAEDLLAIIKEENKGNLNAVFHCFPGYPELIRFALDFGFMVSFTGNITFKKANIIREAAKTMPLEQIMVETDCPYLAPEPFRGKRNEPSYVAYIADEIARVKNISSEEVRRITTGNAKKFFGI